MQFEGAQLAAILDGQSDRVALFDLSGAYREDIEPGVALKIATAGRFVGIGHGKRIRYIRPAGTGVQRGPFAIRRDIAAVMVGFPRLPHVQKNPQKPLQWAPQPTFARTGHAGSFATICISADLPKPAENVPHVPETVMRDGAWLIPESERPCREAQVLATQKRIEERNRPTTQLFG